MSGAQTTQTTQTRDNFYCLLKAWGIWVVAASFYSFEFFLRISPTVMTGDWMREFAVSAAVVGNLSAVYYYAYASMQIPAGLLLDRYGVRPLLTLAAILVAIGSVLFATTDHLWVASIGRACMGVGSAFSFIGCLKLARNWFMARHLAIVIGLTNTLGIVGALAGEAPLALLVNHVGWRDALLGAGVFGVLLALVIRAVIRDKPSMLGCRCDKDSPEHYEASKFWQNFKAVIACRRTWLVAAYGGLMVAPISAFTELWSVPFFMQVDHLTRAKAAMLSSIVFIGIGVGGPLNGWIAGKLGVRRPVMLWSSFGAFLSFIGIVYLPGLPIFILSILLFLFGFFTSSMLLAFSINSEIHAARSTGLAIGFTNMMVMLGGTIFQPLVGFLLDYSERLSHARSLIFNLSSYQHALLVLPLCQILAMLLLLRLRERVVI